MAALSFVLTPIAFFREEYEAMAALGSAALWFGWVAVANRQQSQRPLEHPTAPPKTRR